MESFERQLVDVSKIRAEVQIKWLHSDEPRNASVLGEGFVPFPKKMLRCLHKLFPGSEEMKELSALLAVVDYRRLNLRNNPSAEYLAFLAGLDQAEFTAALQRLERKGYGHPSGSLESLDVSLDGILDKIRQEAT